MIDSFSFIPVDHIGRQCNNADVKHKRQIRHLFF